MTKIYLTIAISIGIFIAYTDCGAKREHLIQGRTMGTTYHIKIVTDFFQTVSGLKEITSDDGKIANLLKPAIENAHHFSQDPIEGAVLANVTRTVSRLNQTEQFEALVAEKTLLICGAIYHLENGSVSFI